MTNLVSKEGEWNNCSIRFSSSDDAFFIHLFVVRRRAKETINGGTYKVRGRYNEWLVTEIQRTNEKARIALSEVENLIIWDSGLRQRGHVL